MESGAPTFTRDVFIFEEERKEKRSVDVKIQSELRSCACEREALIKKPKRQQAVAHVCEPSTPPPPPSEKMNK